MYIPLLTHDIEKLKTMPSDIYIFLPLNNKYLKFLKQGESPSKLAVLSSKNIDKLFINYNNLKNFMAKRDAWGLEESNEVFSAFAQDADSARNKARDIINKKISEGESTDFSFLNYFIADVLNILVPNETSMLYYAFTHLNSGKEVPHSQTVATIAVISAICKNMPLTSLPTLGMAGIYHELPLLAKHDYSKIIDQYKPGGLMFESLNFYKLMPMSSESIRVTVEYHNGDRSDPLCKLLFEADTIVHSGDYSNLSLIC